MITFLATVAVVLLVVSNAWAERRGASLLSIAVTLFVLVVFASGVMR